MSPLTLPCEPVRRALSVSRGRGRRLRRIELFSGARQSVSQSVRTWTQSLGKGDRVRKRLLGVKWPCGCTESYGLEGTKKLTCVD